MEQVELVIKIPNDTYMILKDVYKHGTGWLDKYQKAIVNGTPLPKGHGTLVEGKEVLRKIYELRQRASIFSNNDIMAVLDELIRFVDFMPVIVGSDKKGENDGT